MQTLGILFSPAGRVGQRPFVAAVIVLYLFAVAAYALTDAAIVDRAGPWPFALAQAVLLWIWFALHSRRLHDAGRPIAIAVIAAVLYALAIAVLVAIGAALFSTQISGVAQHDAAGAVGLILIAEIIAVLIGNPHFDLSTVMAAVLVALAIVPPLLAIGVTIYAAIVVKRGDRSG